MYSKKNQIRVFGQRSIASSFVFRSSNIAKDSKPEEQQKDLTRDSCISLSDFLDRILHKNPVLPKSIKGKSRPFLSPVDPRDYGESTDDGQTGMKKQERVRKPAVDELVFEQFKHNGIVEEGDVLGSCGDDESGISSRSFGVDLSHVSELETSSNLLDKQGTRKRRNPFEGDDESYTARKHLLVLGDDLEAKRKGKEGRCIGNRKQKSLFNHYANGCGWWDCDMEGVDTEEVGLGEIWEGVGSSTFGG